MASKHLGSFRVARRSCAPDLRTIIEKLVACFGGTVAGDVIRGESFYVFPSTECAIRNFAVPYLFDECLSKLRTAEDPLAVHRTWNGFWEAEAQCAETNIRLNRWPHGPFSSEIVRMRNWIQKVLGPFDWNEAGQRFAHGPGASTSKSRRNSSAIQKYSGIPDATTECAEFGKGVISLTPPWASALADHPHTVNIVRGNRVTTVPKNRKKRRVIAIEPDLNMYVQKGIGGMIRRRLKKAGIDLNDQSRNQTLAQKALSLDLATIDLSMASDTLAEHLVEILLPADWLAALGMCRSRIGILPSDAGRESVLYRKFSSMGNGYTFELESLIFSACLWAICPSDLKGATASVYGDDIIAPVAVYPALRDLLEYVGFSVNAKKSHMSGLFRESCGKHFFDSCDVTPFYVKEEPDDLLSLFKIHNQIWRLQNRWRWLGFEARQEILQVCAWLRSYAPASWRTPSIIDGLGDGAFVGYLFDDVLPSLKHRPVDERSWDRHYYFRSFVSVSATLQDNLLPGAIAASLHGLERRQNIPLVGRWREHDDTSTFGEPRHERLAVKMLRVRAFDCQSQWTASLDSFV
jgi:hypothetical protein